MTSRKQTRETHLQALEDQNAEPFPVRAESAGSVWISAEDVTPELGQIIDIWVAPNKMAGMRFADCSHDKRGFLLCRDGMYRPYPDQDCVTHWMPVPKGPND